MESFELPHLLTSEAVGTRAKAPPVSIQRESGYEMVVVYLRD